MNKAQDGMEAYIQKKLDENYAKNLTNFKGLSKAIFDLMQDDFPPDGMYDFKVRVNISNCSVGIRYPSLERNDINDGEV